MNHSSQLCPFVSRRAASLAVALALIVVTCGSPGVAGEIDGVDSAPRLTPGGHYTTPRLTPGSGSGASDFGLGVSGRIRGGYGLVVRDIDFDSPAEYAGLESDDVILAVNNRPITSVSRWVQAMSRALDNGGYVRLRIRDCRTGNVVYRDVYL